MTLLVQGLKQHNKHRISILWMIIAVGTLIIACDDEPSVNPEGEVVDRGVNEDLGGSQQPDMNEGIDPIPDPGDDIGVDVDLGPSVDSDVPDMEWTFDLAVIEEEYRDRAPDVSRIYAGYAERPLGFPLGMATVGYFPPPGGFTNPYARSGTDTLHTTLTARALLLRQGSQTVTLLRVDTVAMWQDLIIDLKRKLRDRGRGDLADGLIIGATHTHASGGKIINHPLLRLLAGQFSPALYYRVINNLIQVILEAEQGARPARVGYDTLEVSELHSDRRCENGDVIDHSMGLLKVTDDDDQLIALLINYAMHGTIVDSDEFVFSTDAPGAIEHGIEQRLPQHAPVLYFQSWAGDMSPKVPSEHVTEEGGESRDQYRDLAAIGKGAADIVIPALSTINMSEDLELKVKTIRFPMSDELINPDGDFAHYPHGGAYCYPIDSQNCPEDGQPQQVYEPAELNCLLPVSEADGITWADITAVQIGDLGMITLPGEPLTSVGVDLRDRAIALTGLNQVWILGYAQGYLGYLLHPEDFVLGGYEGSGAIWGPGLGQYLIDRGVEVIGHLIDSTRPLSFRPIPLPLVDDITPEEIIYEEALGDVSWTSQPTRDERGVWSAEWIGGDPSVEAPLVILEYATFTQEGDVESWSPLTHASGLLWSSDGPELEVSLRVEPTYDDRSEQEGRLFYWRVSVPERFSVMPSIGQLNGTFRWVVTGNRPDPYQLESDAFVINLEATP
jgi:hypothetical protein